MIGASLGSVYIVQEACFQACQQAKVFATQGQLKDVGAGVDLPAIVREVVNQQTGRYNSFITQFAAGYQDTALQMYKWILYPLLTASDEELEAGLKYRTMRDILRTHHPEKNNLNLGNLTQALQNTASLQVKKDVKPIVIDYDQTNLRLNVVDRGFQIWIANQDRNELLELAELPPVAAG